MSVALLVLIICAYLIYQRRKNKNEKSLNNLENPQTGSRQENELTVKSMITPPVPPSRPTPSRVPNEAFKESEDLLLYTVAKNPPLLNKLATEIRTRNDKESESTP